MLEGGKKCGNVVGGESRKSGMKDPEQEQNNPQEDCRERSKCALLGLRVGKLFLDSIIFFSDFFRLARRIPVDSHSSLDFSLLPWEDFLCFFLLRFLPRFQFPPEWKSLEHYCNFFHPHPQPATDPDSSPIRIYNSHLYKMDGFSFHFFIAFFAPFLPKRAEEMNAGARSEMEIVVGRGIYGGRRRGKKGFWCVCVCEWEQLLVASKIFFFFLFPVDAEMNADEEAPSERAEEKSVRSCYQGWITELSATFHPLNMMIRLSCRFASLAFASLSYLRCFGNHKKVRTWLRRAGSGRKKRK